MSETTQTLEKTLALALTLSPIEKVRLVERVMATLEDDLQSTASRPRRSLLGILAPFGNAPSEADIDEIRREMWANFPREDI